MNIWVIVLFLMISPLIFSQEDKKVSINEKMGKEYSFGVELGSLSLGN